MRFRARVHAANGPIRRRAARGGSETPFGSVAHSVVGPLRYRIELPGYPILSDGKADNQPLGGTT